MGFLTGLSEGLTYVLDKKAEKEAKEQDRAYQTEMYQQQLRDGRMDSLFKVALERGAFAQSASSNAHELSVLRQLGASDDVIEKVAAYSPKSLQEAVTKVQEKQAAFAGTPLEFGPVQIDALLSTAVSTISEGSNPDYDKAASLLGLNPEELDKPVEGAEGLTYKDLLKGALSTEDTQKVTFLDETVGKPLTGDDVDNILSGAKDSLGDSLKSEIVATSRVASTFAAKASAGPLTEAEKLESARINARMKSLAVAEEDLKRGSVTAAIQLVGGKAILPLLQTNSAAVRYNFGPGWGPSIQEYTFNSAEEVQQAVRDYKVFEGDLVIVDGKVLTVRNMARTQ